MALHGQARQGQADADALELPGAVQALEHPEQLVGVLSPFVLA